MTICLLVPDKVTIYTQLFSSSDIIRNMVWWL